MLVELIGCTSAGKSSLMKILLQASAKSGAKLVSSDCFVLRWAHLDWIKNQTIRTFVLNFIALLACLFTWNKNRVFFRFVVGVIARLPSDIHIAEKLKITRITARNAGIYEIIRRNGSDDEIVLADEGSLHIAHYLFVHVSVTPDLSDLDTFIHFVSLPDLIIYLRQPETVLIARTKARGHKRIPTNATNMVNQFIQHSQVVFEKLIQHSRIKSRLLIMNGDDEFKGFHIHLGHDLREFVRRIKDIGSAPRDKENLRTNPFDFGRNAGQE